MTLFLSTAQNGVDKKGRVSIPALFRAEMAKQSRPVVVVYAAPSQQEKGKCLHAWGYDDFLQLAAKIQRLPALSPVRQRLARTLLAAARPLNVDAEGRIALPEEQRAFASITDKATLAGQGEYFTIWTPAHYDAQAAEDAAHFEGDLATLTDAWHEV